MEERREGGGAPPPLSSRGRKERGRGKLEWPLEEGGKGVGGDESRKVDGADREGARGGGGDGGGQVGGREVGAVSSPTSFFGALGAIAIARPGRSVAVVSKKRGVGGSKGRAARKVEEGKKKVWF